MSDEPKTKAEPKKEPQTAREKRIEYLAGLTKGGKLPASAHAASVAPHEFAAAESLHRWPEYQHAHGHEIHLTKDEFAAAIKAATKLEKGEYVPHKAALYAPKES